MNEITIAPVFVNVTGETKAERQISVVRTASGAALTACINMKGSTGKEIRAGAAQSGFVDIAGHAARGNYKPLAEMLAIRTGEPVVIGSRSTFEALPDIFEARVARAKLAKNGGMREDKKTGALVPGATLRDALELKSIVTDIVRAAAEYHAKRAEAKAAEAIAQ